MKILVQETAASPGSKKWGTARKNSGNLTSLV